MRLLVEKNVTYFGKRYLNLCFLLHVPMLLLCCLPPVQTESLQMGYIHPCDTPCRQLRSRYQLQPKLLNSLGESQLRLPRLREEVWWRNPNTEKEETEKKEPGGTLRRNSQRRTLETPTDTVTSSAWHSINVQDWPQARQHRSFMMWA